MFQLILGSLLMVVSLQSFAQSDSNDFGNSNSTPKVLNAAELRSRFELFGELFVMDAEGRLQFPLSETRQWGFGKKGDLSSNWSYEVPGLKPLALRQRWNLSEDGRLTAHIQQFDSMKRKDSNAAEVVVGKLLKEQKIEVKDFAPIVWVTEEGPGKRVIVRLTPRLVESMDPVGADKMPLSLRRAIGFDGKDRVWVQSMSAEGNFISIKTSQGLIAFSLFPFKGAKEIGFVKENEIRLKGEDQLEIFLKSESPIVTGRRSFKIFGIIDLKKRTDGSGRINVSSSESEEGLLTQLR